MLCCAMLCCAVLSSLLTCPPPPAHVHLRPAILGLGPAPFSNAADRVYNQSPCAVRAYCPFFPPCIHPCMHASIQFLHLPVFVIVNSPLAFFFLFGRPSTRYHAPRIFYYCGCSGKRERESMRELDRSCMHHVPCTHMHLCIYPSIHACMQ